MKFRYDWSRLYRPLFVCAGVVLRSFIICAVLAHQKPIYPFGSARMHCSIKMECLMGCSWVAFVRLNDCDQVYHYAPAIYRPLRASENLPLYTYIEYIEQCCLRSNIIIYTNRIIRGPRLICFRTINLFAHI